MNMSLERIQNYAMRLIAGKPPRTSSAPLRQSLGLTTLKTRRQIATINQVKLCLVDCAPMYKADKFLTISLLLDITGQEERLHLKRPNTNFHKHSFEFQGAVLYNSLPEGGCNSNK